LAAGAGTVLPRLFGCSEAATAGRHTTETRTDARRFLDQYSREYQRLHIRASEAAWLAMTDVKEEHTQASAKARQEVDAYVGRQDNMETLAALRMRAWGLSPLTAREVEHAWMLAANAPGIVPDLVKRRAEAEAEQSMKQDGFQFTLSDSDEPARVVTANEIDEILIRSTDPKTRLDAWVSSKEIGKELKPGLVQLQQLRNGVARAMNYSSFFGLRVADYGMAVDELMGLMKNVMERIRPLYEHVHCYARHELARRYGQPAPRRIPAHWLPNRWGQAWPGLVAGVDLDPLFESKTSEWIVQQSERFYTSMGFPALPASFWKKSDLYDLPPDSIRKKNTHASAWHIDFDHDVRSLMSVKPDARWFSTTHHELGHIYYFLAYSTPRVPLLLREGANRAFHEGIGDLISLASQQRPYLDEIGLTHSSGSLGGSDESISWLLAEALEGSIVFLPFACGTMTGFEHDLYEKDLAPNRYNARWWELVKQHQGIDPPSDRGEEYCDAATKTHINDDPGEYYDYAIGRLIVYQLHDYIARNILKQDPRSCNYYNRKDVGEYLMALLSSGASRDWREVLRTFTGEDLSARAMMDYYAPLMEHLEKVNRGRDVSFT
jgi:peptidyl-dipeptidase A